MTKRRDDLLVAKIDAAEACIHAVDLVDIESALSQLDGARQTIDSAIRTGVEKARAEGVTWQQIANALGLASRQTAEARFGG